jgi:hypothetical protein
LHKRVNNLEEKFIKRQRLTNKKPNQNKSKEVKVNKGNLGNENLKKQIETLNAKHDQHIKPD